MLEDKQENKTDNEQYLEKNDCRYRDCLERAFK
jgi:hypothetical protein